MRFIDQLFCNMCSMQYLKSQSSLLNYLRRQVKVFNLLFFGFQSNNVHEDSI